MIGEELKRIEKNNNGELPDGPKIIIGAVHVKNPKEVMQKTKEVMAAISKYAYTNTWPSDEEWKTKLPKWFVESMTSKSLEEIMKTDGQWHYESWIDNIRMRAWVWWSSKVEEESLYIVLEALSMPYLHDSLKYILHSQGIPMENIYDRDDVYDAVD